ncbi:MAG: cation diffusion facilitator family transporter [Chloroflexi bacterium]|nr:cation diffusion facilitator family transporter [Chloroflexota bacterium]
MVAESQSRKIGISQEKERSVRAGWLLGLFSLLPTVLAVIIGHSTTLLAGLFKMVCETLASFLAWLSLRKVARGETGVYQYGYGKLENLSSLAVAGAMVISFTIVLYGAIDRVRHPAPIGQVWLGLLTTSIAFALNVWLWLKNYRLARKDPSPIMESQWRLFRTKSINNLSVISALGLSVLLRSYSWSLYIDPLGSLIVAGFLLSSAYDVASASVHDLLDQTLEEALQFIILQELAAYFDEYERFHGVRSRKSGSDVYVEIFLEFDGQQKMAEVQSVIDKMKASLEQKIQNSHISIVPTTSPVAIFDHQP